MIEMTFYRFTCCCDSGFFTPHYFTHIEAELYEINDDSSRSKPYSVDFSPGSSEPLTEVHKSMAAKVTLQAEGLLQDFIADYESRFRSEDYHCCSQNCADAAYYILEYFFGDEPAFRKIDAGCDLYKLLCCLPCVGSLGIAACFPVPPCFNSPRDVFDKAMALSVTLPPAEKVPLLLSGDGLGAEYSGMASYDGAEGEQEELPGELSELVGAEPGMRKRI